MPTIIDLQRIISGLKPEEKLLFDRIFFLQESIGSLVFPESMKQWANKTFGDYHSLESQKIIKVFNRITFEESLFNDIRAKRPMAAKSDEESEKIIKEAQGDSFCKPLRMTPSDDFGRIRGWRCISASNVAKYDSLHGIIIFKKHNPLVFDEKDILDYFGTAMRWYAKANKTHKEAVYPFLLWNCLWRSGASLIHGHMQMVLADKMHYAQAEYYNTIRKQYSRHNGTDYFNDLYLAHKAIGLGLEKGKIKIFASITPKKEKEITIISEKAGKDFFSAIYKIADSMVKEMGVQSFNLGIIMPPLDQKKREAWIGFPFIARIVDRGKLANKTADVAGMELYSGASVIESDPYVVFDKIKNRF